MMKDINQSTYVVMFV